MDLEKFEKANVKFEKVEMSTLKGGTSTTLLTVVGFAENEYEDVNDNGELDKDDKFLGTVDLPL